MKNFSAVILAAGAGTRMKSSLPKVMHKLSGKPLINWVIDAVGALKPDNIVVVLGHKSESVEESLKNKNVKIVYQKQQLGSAHALMQAQKAFKNYKGDILVMCGDVPLVKTSVLSSLLKHSKKNKSSVTVLAAKADDPYGYGRIVKSGGILEKIAEEKDATEQEKLIREVNSGIYCFDNNVWKALSKVKPDNAKKEYYLTDTIEILKKLGKKATSVTVGNAWELMGINDRSQLHEAEKELQKIKIAQLFEKGVSIIDADNTYISYNAQIGQDTVIYPGAFIDTDVKIGKGCTIQGSSYIKNSVIADNVCILYSYINGAKIGTGSKIGPFSHIRPGSVLEEGVKVGNFSETKKTVISKNSKVNHLSYIGDAEIGENVNIGAGTITCNYDGKNKHKTVIASDAFVGSNVNFVAPVKIGKGALIAAGSTITNDIPPGKLAIARARQELKYRKK
ncbi:MAG: bifunctional UDP-N-acetylglucosamine diphosphorylase/glucosamine-1-phosphate N-acetyltransferase GlmU [Endomicrobium sp.]|jgi:bifunctional UDP-N-acetylglucosamine pyrophosphorylase/glucosamine-1-phosphate N-acetyltransferase|nr:bifunctional UDP-N-acetylglucosamine diphosphorylase/glucosamine-1-phosphate N-acetyltransferase GlmU [Endomicrobium sp.]